MELEAHLHYANLFRPAASTTLAQMHKAARQQLSNGVEYDAGAEHILADVDMNAFLRAQWLMKNVHYHQLCTIPIQ